MREQVVAPSDGVAQRLLAGREVAGTSSQGGEAAVQPVAQRLRRQQLDPRRGQLDGERQAVQPADDLGHHSGVVRGQGEARAQCLRSRGEERDRIKGGQLRHGRQRLLIGDG